MQHFGPSNVKAMDFAVKYKYDEVSLRLRSHSSKSGGEAQVTKLVVCSATWMASWRLDHHYVNVQFRLAIILRCIEANSAKCMVHALAHQVGVPALARSMFDSCSSDPIADSHRANEVADDALLAADPDTTPQK